MNIWYTILMRIVANFKIFIKEIVNILFPNLCFSCLAKTENNVLCSDCYNKIQFVTAPVCILCQNPSNTRICGKCLKKRIYYDRLICVMRYTGPIKDVIHNFKYTHHNFLADFLSEFIFAYIEAVPYLNICEYTLTAVPIHPAKLKERGYNQSYLLAKKIANNFKIPVKNDIIFKIKDNMSQTELKKTERADNVINVFDIDKNIPVNGKIMIIDDIFTTGSTVNECARLLKEHGAKEVVVLTLAKTVL
ncbi:MAG: ComF family protein [Candidatus Omnitrophica bacterium]|nr:ComF family protein [Candidatus Omnitrophota bacterium]